MKLIVGPVRFSYVNISEPRSVNGSEPKYSVTLIIPKTDVTTLQKISVAIEKAKIAGVHKFGGTIPTNLKTPLRDGDLDRPEDAAYANSYFINANSIYQPGVVDINLQPLDASELYSGCFGRASVTFYAYSTQGENDGLNQGIACGLRHLQKIADGEPLGGPGTAAEDFGSESLG